MSPAIRWEKNSMGILRIFHMNSEFPTIASLPLIRMEYTTLIQETASCIAVNTDRRIRKGIAQSGFFPVSSRSMNT